MLPALAEIVSNVVGLQLDSNITAAVLGAVLAPLLRSEPHESPHKRAARRPRAKRRSASRKRKYKRHAPTEARDRALAALKVKPGATLTEIAKVAKVSRSTAANVARELAAEARKAARKSARKAARETPKPAPTERQQRAQRFLKDALAHGPKRATDVEEAASKAHVDPHALDQARADLSVLVSRSNTGVQAVKWSLPAP